MLILHLRSYSGSSWPTCPPRWQRRKRTPWSGWNLILTYILVRWRMPWSGWSLILVYISMRCPTSWSGWNLILTYILMRWRTPWSDWNLILTYILMRWRTQILTYVENAMKVFYSMPILQNCHKKVVPAPQSTVLYSKKGGGHIWVCQPPFQ